MVNATELEIEVDQKKIDETEVKIEEDGRLHIKLNNKVTERAFKEVLNYLYSDKVQ